MKNERMKKLAGLAAAAAVSLVPVLSVADTADSALVQGGHLNLRQEASLTAGVLGQYPTGTLVEIVKPGSQWHQVMVNGKAGYMLAKYLNTAEKPVNATVRTNTGIGLNLREEPRMTGRIVTSFKPGTQVTVTQQGRQWSRVKAEGREGFMATEYLIFGGSEASGTAAVVNNPKDTQVLNLRQTASLDAKVLASYRNGTQVTVLTKGETWCKVRVEDGKTGYMMTRYLKFAGEAQSATAVTFNVNGGSYVNFRRKPSLGAEVISRIPVNTRVTVLERGADWHKVEIDGVVGYMSAWFLR